MNIRKFNILIALSAFLLSGNALCSAHDFSVVDKSGNKFFFNVTDTLKNTVELTYEGLITPSDDTFKYEGEIQIPSRVKYRDVVYRVASIGPKAFSGCDALVGVMIPTGVSEIKDFAFDGCTSLSKIIFPSNVVTIGEGVFFRCPSIQNVTLGGDWFVVDLKVFEWSDSLNEIRIPAKVKTIRNMKSLDNLDCIDVDVNNSNFTSVDGVLYNKDVTVMYGCPRDHKGKVVVPEGVESILKGALTDCRKVTFVDLPSTLSTISYFEFAGMDSLTQVYMRADEPVNNCMAGDIKVFAFKAPKSGSFSLYVQKSALKAYKSAIFSGEADYSDMNGKNIRRCTDGDMITQKSIKGVKSFEK